MSALQTAKNAWGEAMPSWVETLANECVKRSQNKVAKDLKCSGALVSQVLNNKYGAGYDIIKERIEGLFMACEITCPARGQIPSNICQDWRKKARVFSSANPLRIEMYKACNACPKHKGE